MTTIQSMYSNAKRRVEVNVQYIEELEVKVGYTSTRDL